MRPDELTGVARDAIATAAAVFEQLSAQADAPVGPVQARDGLAAAVHLFADVVLRIVDAVILELPGVDQGPAAAEGTVTLRGAPGSTASTSIWVHNMTASPWAGITLRLTDLTGHDGTRLCGPAVFDPGELTVAGDASGHSSLQVGVPPAAPPGVYHGHVLAPGVPDAALPVRLVVEM